MEGSETTREKTKCRAKLEVGIIDANPIWRLSAERCSRNADIISIRPHHFPLHLHTMAKVLQNVYRMAFPLAIGGMLVQNSLYDVRGGTRAVIFDRVSGVQEKVVNEGTHFLIPWLQRAIVYDVRTKPRNISTTTGSKDLQMVSLTLRVLHRPEVPKLPQIYQVGSPWSLLASIQNAGTNSNSSSPTVPITMNVFSPLSEMKSSRLSWPSSMPPS